LYVSASPPADVSAKALIVGNTGIYVFVPFVYASANQSLGTSCVDPPPG
jgi:hypothetical protein